MSQFAKEILPVSIEDEMRQSYLDYAMSVIVGRALPDVRDGLKPVHRRILHSMNTNAGSGWRENCPQKSHHTRLVQMNYHKLALESSSERLETTHSSSKVPTVNCSSTALRACSFGTFELANSPYQ